MGITPTTVALQYHPYARALFHSISSQVTITIARLKHSTEFENRPRFTSHICFITFSHVIELQKGNKHLVLLGRFHCR